MWNLHLENKEETAVTGIMEPTAYINLIAI